ncbi:FKBP-type peptidyl-prolyl cis-trans isomerase [Qipengyuania citrea]|jgi:FKBP-type peptidyl-prolyl cis-trans isomerase 2|uniref:Peptidyl-prolyl cis-trans isomerase n=2 Tax=Qipengyuania TaxID=1855416 RepID=A0ABY4U2E4_9SPHN|nr:MULTISPECIES: FKBP-type peptidyl-prolyl cis-trans isomerase [Qipengyuania]MAB45003.1 peptidylprolyl isomerase [Sphingomonadaceae bacterium]MAG41809.1 peptidylprolyl isomerase [Erythrobacteraceae bacterium]MBL4897461.1 FKBP-type peptidyl-prolyl cis-trans isomerase [Erythrobacter sp.]MEC7954238.1 FKBP-type peptidyl-prolyl cis-trans isomerase [Pseudomonadota bacterium]QPL38339.1 FKBP-type peptidyl-prolyl cis-trans isomerase [Erythrobacter sp. A30-3]|tara:strand:- start:2062 stop:2499 length:438 start_codon:yes stop_codon:yes gene_type:complete
MTTPNSGDTVTIDYVLKRTDGEEVGNTQQAGPQDITIGSGQIFPQIEEALTGMAVGEEQSVSIDCANAFGPRQDALVIDIPRENLPPEPAPQPGMAMQAQAQDGSPMTLYIVEVGDQTIKADGNHPLAGEDLTFDITLRDIKQAA